MTKIFVDGSGKTGQYCYVVGTKVRILKKRGVTNNEAEYLAVIAALEENKQKNISIYSDSQLIINQLNKKWKIKEKRLKALAEHVHSLCKGRNITFTWIPRGKNIAGKILEKYTGNKGGIQVSYKNII